MLHLFQDIFKSPAQDFSVIFPWLFQKSLKNVNKRIPTISQIPISLTCNEIGHAEFKDINSEANVLDSDVLGFGNIHQEHFHLFSLLSALTSEFFLFTFPSLQLREKLLKSWVLLSRFLCWPSVSLHWNPTELTTSPYQVKRYTEINASQEWCTFFSHFWFCLDFATCINHHLLLGNNSYLLYLIFRISNFLL